MKKLEFAVTAVIFNSIGEVLAVSRKDDHNDMNLPGGKVDPEDNTLLHALEREVMEETGLEIDILSCELIFSMHKDGYMGYTYLVKDWEGEFDYDEPHIVKWTNYQTVMQGSFGKWNALVNQSLRSMGVEFMMYPKPKKEYEFVVINGGGYGEWYTMISVKGEGRYEQSQWTQDEYMDVNNIFGNSEYNFGFYDEVSIEIADKNGAIEDPKRIENILLELGLTKVENYETEE